MEAFDNTSINLSEDFFERHIERIDLDWSHLSNNLYLSEDFLERHIERIDWSHLSNNLNLDPDYGKNIVKKHITKKLQLARVLGWSPARYLRITKLMKTNEFIEWYYDPDNTGGKNSKNRAISQINNMLQKRK